jgi:predicted amidophosphoribosyltransferase
MEDPASRLVHGLKYGGWRPLAELMAERMARVPIPAGPGALLTPVPTTPGRRRMRGYNQAAVLAVAVARLRRGACLEVLERPRGGSQVKLGPRARESNVSGGFRVRAGSGSRITGREVILIDDVLTTGATARSAAETLSRAGAGPVHLLTFARALPFAGGDPREARG